jgi:hypothetical protein
MRLVDVELVEGSGGVAEFQSPSIASKFNLDQLAGSNVLSHLSTCLLRICSLMHLTILRQLQSFAPR